MDRPTTDTPRPPRRAVPRWALVAPALLLSVALIAGIGPDHGPFVGAAAVALTLIDAGPLAAVYALASAGWGMLLAPLVLGRNTTGEPDPERRWLTLLLGLGTMLTLSHLLGWLVGWRGAAGRAATLAPIGIGILAFLLLTLRERRATITRQTPAPTLPRLRVSTLCSCVGLAVLVVASCSTPGLLWDSEFGGFDALSYHLQLPREWLERGTLTPLTHNVYSFLPSAIESAYTHLGALRGGMLAGSGAPLIASQLLHAAITVLAAGLIGRCCDAAARMAALDDNARAAARMTGWALTLVTPWTIVVGSLAYNEMGVMAFGAGAILISTRTTLSVPRRSAVCAFFVGMACCCKPTALFMVGPVAALMLAALTPVRAWTRAILPGLLVGSLTLAPFLVRNWQHGGNPVFPHMHALFGNAHWNTEQLARYLAAHHSDLPLADRLSLLIWPQTGDPARPTAPVQRGLLHDQFFAFLPLVLLACAGMILSRWRRRLLKPLILFSIGATLQLIAWLSVTHLQSRFLVPLLLTGVPLVGLAMAMAVSEHTILSAAPPTGDAVSRRRSIRIRRRALMASINAGILIQAAWLLLLFAQQGRGNPNALLLVTPAHLTGEAFRLEREQARDTRAIDDNISPSGFINLALTSEDRLAPRVLYLLGDSTPLYFPTPLLYHTTYDASPLGELMAIYPNTPDEWARTLWDMGIRYVLLNVAELDRLRNRSGWYDPRVTPEAAKSFLDSHADLLRAWPASGQGLYLLRPPAPRSGAGA
ncbi:MAG: hypothetical protein KF902_12925 [Phycisphaeraceae bacterium]|nr:hypothetical protein [Phycisphaeraceae bacterium]